MAERVESVLAQTKILAMESAESLETKISNAEKAFAVHRKSSFGLRSERILKAAEILEKEVDRFAECMTAEMGKPFKQAKAEVLKCALVCKYYAAEAEAMVQPEPVASGYMNAEIHYQPLGVVLAVMPWNYPFWQVFRFAAPALMAGNVALLKHASNVPRCSHLIEEIFVRAGFDHGEFQSVYVRGSSAAAMVADDRIAAVTLTGSEGAGRAVGAAAGAAIKKVVLELGGSDPFVIMPSADLEKAIDGAIAGRMLNNGQSCIAAKRILIHESIYDVAVEKLKERIAELKVGDPFAEDTEIGPLALPEFAAELQEQVHRAVTAGAKVLVGGKISALGAAYFEPTLIVDLPRESAVAGEEFFGPVMMVFKVQDCDDAIELANATAFGLGASVWTSDMAEGRKLAAAIESGQVFVNAVTASDPRLPFGGTKRSGIGRELGTVGIREFVNLKTVAFGQ